MIVIAEASTSGNTPNSPVSTSSVNSASSTTTVTSTASMNPAASTPSVSPAGAAPSNGKVVPIVHPKNLVRIPLHQHKLTSVSQPTSTTKLSPAQIELIKKQEQRDNYERANKVKDDTPLQRPGDLPSLASSEVPAQTHIQAWVVIPAESDVNFSGSLNDENVVGKFKHVHGDIMFDPDDLSNGHVNVIVDIGSLSTSYMDIAEAIASTDWLSQDLFPVATFEAGNFNYVEPDQYSADGILTIRGKKNPTKVVFTVAQLAENKQQATGSFIIQRSEFGVGHGRWASAGNVNDDVAINFTITAKRK